MVKKKGLKKFNISNKLAYTLIVVLSIALLGIGVYAYGGTNPPVMGHSLGEIQVPAGCLAGQVMKLSGGVWACGVDDETDSRFTVNSNGALCWNIPATCTVTSTFCGVTNPTFYELPPGITCDTIGNLANQVDMCLTLCSEDIAYPCDGRSPIPSCTGGTVTYWSDTQTTALCEGGNEIWCNCRANTWFQNATYNAAGPHCVF